MGALEFWGFLCVVGVGVGGVLGVVLFVLGFEELGWEGVGGRTGEFVFCVCFVERIWWV